MDKGKKSYFNEEDLEKQLSKKEEHLYEKESVEKTEKESTEKTEKESVEKPKENKTKVNLNYQNRSKDTFKFDEDVPKAQLGWTLLNKELIPTQGLFYDADVLNYARPIKTKEIRDYTSIEEDNTISIANKIETILSIATKMTSQKQKLSYKDIYDIDKIFYMFAIRDLTFYNITNPLKNPTVCTNSSCRHEYNVELFSYNIIFFEPSDFIMKYYNPDQNCFTLNLDTNESINIKLPTIGIKEKLNEYIQWRKKIGANINENAIKIIPYMDFDWREVEKRTFDEFLTRTVSWSPDLYSLVIKFIREIKNCMKMKAISICPECGAEVTAPIRFQGGFSDFFLIQNVFERIG